MPEQPYTVDASHIPRGGHRRRKSMEPRALSVIDGNLVSNAKSSLHSLHPQQHQHQHQHSEVQNTPATATAAAAAAAAAATTISSGRTPALAGSTNRKVSSPLEDRLISFESSSDRRKSRNWTPRVISAEQHQELVAEHEEGVLHLDLHNDQQQQQRPSLGLCATPIARGDLSSMTVELTPMSGVVMHGLLEAGHADLAAQEPGTPYFLQPQQLVQRTCPPKQQGLGSGVLPDEDEEEDAGNERDGRGEVRRKLVWGGDARRVTMDWRPATASPLRRAF